MNLEVMDTYNDDGADRLLQVVSTLKELMPRYWKEAVLPRPPVAPRIRWEYDI
jgi:hypothetical protein